MAHKIAEAAGFFGILLLGFVIGLTSFRKKSKEHSRIRNAAIGIMIVFFCLLLGSCTSEHDFSVGEQQLEVMGYHDIHETGYAWFCCDDNDDFETGFKAVSAKGDTVAGCFCSTLTKGVTIRFK